MKQNNHEIEKTLDQFFNHHDAYRFLIDRIQDSSPDSFDNSDIRTAQNILIGIQSYHIDGSISPNPDA